MSEILTFEEICRIAAAAALLGIRHIRVTGGEPLVRKSCCELIRMLKWIPGIETVTLTTNGVLLEQYLDELADAGVDGINISLDTRDREQFAWLTGTDALEQVLRGLSLAVKCPIPVKVNVVSQAWTDWKCMAELARDYPVDVRFIELMPIGMGKEFPLLSHEKLFSLLCGAYPDMEPDGRAHGQGPAVYYRIPGFSGSIGLISAIHGKFCAHCNRVRLTSQGFFKTCLCYGDGVDLRGLLRADAGEKETQKRLADAMRAAILQKPEAHFLDKPGWVSETKNMSDIGG
jgi:cyclic pyranopterin phosphate synthase